MNNELDEENEDQNNLKPIELSDFKIEFNPRDEIEFIDKEIGFISLDEDNFNVDDLEFIPRDESERNDISAMLSSKNDIKSKKK
ncbi:MAG: hypothetical protein ACFFE4_13570 [Candidatus Thorarchaeota archaeon]